MLGFFLLFDSSLWNNDQAYLMGLAGMRREEEAIEKMHRGHLSINWQQRKSEVNLFILQAQNIINNTSIAMPRSGDPQHR